MIRYPISEDELVARVQALSPTWMDDADARTEAFRALGKYHEAKGNWSAIKSIYIALQHGKCAFCERKFSVGAIEHDVEHFRPKSRVDAWPPTGSRWPGPTYRFETGAAMPSGYYLLAYRLLNYLTACKRCNSTFKANFFPIAGQRGHVSDRPADFAAERSFLPYPIGTIDEDPEKIITFRGYVPVPTTTSPRSVRYRRASVTIDLLQLHLREELLEERADVIVKLWMALELEQISPEQADRDRARASITTAVSAKSRHASCARAFVKVYENDRDLADELYAEAHGYLNRE